MDKTNKRKEVDVQGRDGRRLLLYYLDICNPNYQARQCQKTWGNCVALGNAIVVDRMRSDAIRTSGIRRESRAERYQRVRESDVLSQMT